MFAIFETGGKQYRAEKGATVKVEKLPEDANKKVVFNRVYLVSDGKTANVGMPYVDGASVTAKVKDHGREDKIRVVKFQAKKRVKKIQGHRQAFTEIEITDIAVKAAKKVEKKEEKKEEKA
jgi:large subunit ribosomal protein L21